jgi:REP element-mobilizing transposase RayT
MGQLSGFTLDDHVLMPNHFHAVVVVNRASEVAPRLGGFVAQFKSRVSKAAGEGIWQRGYHDHWVRGDEDLYRIRTYIANNPLKWHLDKANPERVGENGEEDAWF